jgi:hypothetical protein
MRRWVAGERSYWLEFPPCYHGERVELAACLKGWGIVSDIDRRNRLGDEPFAFRVSKNGSVFVSWQGRTVTTLNGKDAERFLAQIDGLDGQEAQLVMAKVTGNFKRGNERLGKDRSRS